MELCVSSGIYGKTAAGAVPDFVMNCELAKNAGFEALDFGLNTAALTGDGWEAAVDYKAETAAKYGLRIRYVHLPFGYPAADDTEGWEQFLTASKRGMELTKKLGADCAAIHPRTSMKADYDEDMERAAALEFLRPYSEYAHHVGVTLALENMRGAGMSAPAKIRRFATRTEDLIELADENDLGICWDTGHGNISMQDQLKSLRKIGSRLKMVHLNDNYAEDDIHLAPFLGNIRWDEVVRGLREIGYRGSLNLEVGCGRCPEEARPAYAAYMYRAAAKLDRMMTE